MQGSAKKTALNKVKREPAPKMFIKDERFFKKAVFLLRQMKDARISAEQNTASAL